MPTSPKNEQADPRPSPKVTLDTVEEIGNRVQRVIARQRARQRQPNNAKTPPRYSSVQLAAMCGVDKNAVNRRLSNPNDPLPKGEAINAARREFTLAEAQLWAKTLGIPYQRPAGTAGAVIAVANFKGGVTKTTTAACLAQGLSLRGYKVLVIDFDPQGSLTQIFGYAPESEIAVEQTFLPIAYGSSNSLRPAIQSTYWNNVDIVGACPLLFEADFQIPSRQSSELDLKFWKLLDDALDVDGVRQEYDYIIIDTPPSMSYMNLVALFASDGVLVPLPPEMPDFASSAMFWGLFAGLSKVCESRDEVQKEFSWIRVLPAKVNRNYKKDITTYVLSEMGAAYGGELLPLEIPDTQYMSFAGSQFGTVYDIARFVDRNKAYKGIRDTYDQLVERVDSLTRFYKWNAAVLPASS